jgi:hypothetical protein
MPPLSINVLHGNVYDWKYGSVSPSTYAGGAVASVTGDVGGNVLGSVASVSGNVGGNVAGSVNSVVMGVTLANDAITAAKIATDAFTADKFAVSALELIAQTVESHLLDEGDSQMLINAIVGAIGNMNVDEVALVAAIRADLERSGGNLATIITQLALKATQAALDVVGLDVLTTQMAAEAAQTAAAALNARVTEGRMLVLDAIDAMIEGGAFTPEAMVNAGGTATLDPDTQLQIDNMEDILDGIEDGSIRVAPMGVE